MSGEVLKDQGGRRRGRNTPLRPGIFGAVWSAETKKAKGSQRVTTAGAEREERRRCAQRVHSGSLRRAAGSRRWTPKRQRGHSRRSRLEIYRVFNLF